MWIITLKILDAWLLQGFQMLFYLILDWAPSFLNTEWILGFFEFKVQSELWKQRLRRFHKAQDLTLWSDKGDKDVLAVPVEEQESSTGLVLKLTIKKMSQRQEDWKKMSRLIVSSDWDSSTQNFRSYWWMCKTFANKENISTIMLIHMSHLGEKKMDNQMDKMHAKTKLRYTFSHLKIHLWQIQETQTTLSLQVTRM